jgi:hypothetical protein
MGSKQATMGETWGRGSIELWINREIGVYESLETGFTWGCILHGNAAKIFKQQPLSEAHRLDHDEDHQTNQIFS